MGFTSTTAFTLVLAASRKQSTASLRLPVAAPVKIVRVVDNVS